MVASGADRATVIFPSEDHTVGAGRLAERGRRWFRLGAPARAVGAVLTNDATSVALVLGAIVSGARLVSLPLPPRGGDPRRYAAFLSEACAQQGVERVVARDDAADLLKSVGVPSVGHGELDGEQLSRPTSGGFELVQFSSGTTGPPKGVRLSEHTLGQNIAAIADAVAPTDGDVAVSWLPLSHDMGLVGMLLTSIAVAADLTGIQVALIEPERFLVRPRVWLDAIDRYRGSYTASPDAGLRLAVAGRGDRHVDLSALRCVIVGGEIIRARTLEAFETAFGADGLSALALCPAYGMAEIGLAATMTRPEDRWASTVLDSVALAEGRWVAPDAGGSQMRLVASGRPLDGYGVVVRSVGADVGTLHVTVPSAGADAVTGRPFADRAGVVRTADRGMVANDLLYVCGRADDHIVTAGRNVYAPAIEDAVGDVEGVRPGRVTVIDVPDGSWVVVVERVSRGEAEDERPLRDRVRRAVVAAVGADPDEVVILARGQLPMTSSGKVQRHAVRQRWSLDRFGLATGGDPP